MTFSILPRQPLSAATSLGYQGKHHNDKEVTGTNSSAIKVGVFRIHHLQTFLRQNLAIKGQLAHILGMMLESNINR